MTSALLLVDFQNDYFPHGKMALDDIEQAAGTANKLLRQFREKNLPIYHIQHVSLRANATFFLPHSDGVKINDSVTPLTSEIVITKHYPNSFRETPLLESLHAYDIKNLIITGAMSHMCIDATTRAAFDYQFNCTVIEDACATKDLIFENTLVPAKQVHAAFMSALNGVYAEVKAFYDWLN
jgi:nicotinamidase-related amidase